MTFPMLSEARIESVKRLWVGASPSIDLLQMKLARLKAHRAAQNFQTKLSLLAHALEQRYSPNQPRVPAGSREGGRWTSGAGESGAAEDQYALTVDPNVAGDIADLVEPTQQPDLIDLHDEEYGDHNGHTIRDHIGKSEAQLRHETEASRRNLGIIGIWKDRIVPVLNCSEQASKLHAHAKSRARNLCRKR